MLIKIKFKNKQTLFLLLVALSFINYTLVAKKPLEQEVITLQDNPTGSIDNKIISSDLFQQSDVISNPSEKALKDAEEEWEREFIDSAMLDSNEEIIRTTEEDMERDFLAADLATFVNSPLWLRTSPTRTRPPLYLIPGDKTVLQNRKGLFFAPYFNFTRQVVSPFQDHLQFDVDLPLLFFGISQKLAQEFGLDPQFVSDVLGTVDFLKLFAKFDIEERRAGISIEYNIKSGKFFFGFDTDLLLVERNFITPPDIETQLRNIFVQLFGRSQGFDEKKFLARIALGIGDMRFKFGFNPIDNGDYKLLLGLSTTLPTASGIILDGNFDKAENPEIHPFVDPLIRSSQRMLLDGALGGNGHFSAGLFTNFQVRIVKDDEDRRKLNFVVNLLYDKYSPDRISIRHLTTKRQNRYFMFKQNITSEDVQRDSLNTDLENKFIQQFLIPQQFTVALNPGDIFEATAVLDGKWHSWAMRIGYDFFLQQKETLIRLYGTKATVSDLRIGNGLNGRLEQHKILAELGYNSKIWKTPLKLTLGGDYTVRSIGTGKDWTFYFRIGSAF